MCVFMCVWQYYTVLDGYIISNNSFHSYFLIFFLSFFIPFFSFSFLLLPLLPSFLPPLIPSPSLQLLTTIPLDITLKWVNQPTLSARLTYSSSHIIGLGLRGENPHDTYALYCTYCTSAHFLILVMHSVHDKRKGRVNEFTVLFLRYFRFPSIIRCFLIV